LDSEKQEEMMNRAKFIISRPGYTTVMDIVELEKKKALFVPTPGQPEQEYFGELYEKEKLFKIVDQDKLDLRKDLKKSGKYTGYKALWKTNNSVEKFTNLVYSK
jgi:predicted glycosyltransferase